MTDYSQLPYLTPETEDERFAATSSRDSTVLWGGFLAGLFNWYLLAKTVLIYQSELMLSVRGSRCGTCWQYANHQIYVMVPFYLILGGMLCKAVSVAAPFWINWTKWPLRLATLGWLSVIGAVVIANWM